MEYQGDSEERSYFTVTLNGSVIKSTRSPGFSEYVRFHNCTDRDIDVFWINYEGHSEHIPFNPDRSSFQTPSQICCTLIAKEKDSLSQTDADAQTRDAHFGVSGDKFVFRDHLTGEKLKIGGDNSEIYEVTFRGLDFHALNLGVQWFHVIIRRSMIEDDGENVNHLQYQCLRKLRDQFLPHDHEEQENLASERVAHQRIDEFHIPPKFRPVLKMMVSDALAYQRQRFKICEMF